MADPSQNGHGLTASRRIAALVVAVFLTATTSACMGSTKDGNAKATSAPIVPLSKMNVVDDPRTLTGPGTAALENRNIKPVAGNAKPDLPVTVTSHDKNGTSKVTVKDTSRVVTFDMAGSISSTVWGLGQGDRLVGRDVTADFPGAHDLPVVTKDGHSIDIESVIALRPTLVLTDGTIGPIDVVEQLRDVGIPVVFVKNVPSFAGAASLAEQVGAAMGVPKAGDALAERISSEVAEVTQQIERFVPEDSGKKLRIVFLYIRGDSGVYYLFGTESGADDLIDALGGVDVASDMGWKGMRPLTDEALVKAKPDVILTMTHGLESTSGVSGLIDARPAIALTEAGKNSRIIDMADSDILSFGPRSAGVVEALARAVYSPGKGS